MGRNVSCLFLVMCFLVSGICAQMDNDTIRQFDFSEESLDTDGTIHVTNTTNEGNMCDLKDGSRGRYLSGDDCEDVLSRKEQPLMDQSGQFVCCRNYSTYMVEKVCERLTAKDKNVRIQTLQGNHVELGDFPHMAAIGYLSDPVTKKLEFLCSGTLVSDLFVLVAAQCIANKEDNQPYLVRLGTADLKGSFDTNYTDYLVAKSIAHPGYERLKKKNDIGLLRLARKVKKFTKTIHPACLDFGLADPRTTMTLVGFDLIRMTMQKTSMVTVGHRECEAVYNTGGTFRRINPKGLPPTQMCASMVPGQNGEYQCERAIGALHLPVENTSSLYTVVGLQSYGRTCGTGIPDVFTRVTKYLPWITKTVWPEGDISFADDF